jgi:hypothetical protein
MPDHKHIMGEPLKTHPLLLTPQECKIVLAVRSIEHGTVQVRIQDHKIVLIERTDKEKLV